MKSWMTNRSVCCAVLGMAFAAGCSAPPAPLDPAARAGLIIRQHADRERVTRELIDEAMTAPPIGERAAAAILVSDRSTGALADAIHSVDSARGIVLNNLCNAETTAYKACRAILIDGKVSQTALNMDQGSLESTNRQLDLAIQGPGFFQIKLASSVGDGVGYTRNGNFFVNKNHELVLGMGDGYRLVPPITFPSDVTEIGIDTEGVLSVLQSGLTAKTVIGRFQLAQFPNAEGLTLIGGSIFTANESSGMARINNPGENGTGTLLQGFLEGSNVDLIRERLRLRFLQEWRALLLEAVDRPVASKFVRVPG